MLGSQLEDGAGKQLHLGLAFGLGILAHGWTAVLLQCAQNPDVLFKFLFGQVNAFSFGNRHDLVHGSRHGCIDLRGVQGTPIGCLVDHASLVDPDIEQEFAPECVQNIWFHRVGQSGPVQKLPQGLQGWFLRLFQDADLKPALIGIA